jgi:hypothetical protein
MVKSGLAPVSILDRLRTGELLPDGGTFGAVLNELSQSGQIAAADAISVFGDGLPIVKDKNTLVGVPLIITGWKFNDGDHGEFVSLTVVSETGKMQIVNDGSSGIYSQMRAYEDAGRTDAILCRHGLRASSYTYTDAKTGAAKPAVTFYLDTSA